ncbi:hypothetical protein HO173_007985 [Letharia columbiana]|uniref:Uncharacterized protein n=1 Tax=Letharia columbiana TaxID=112416 RepID=A0A8H6FSD8_9LECA|nr:uncharacterized protein HO173_007985 [Letharia columbiana]KAF6233773.1 hypothetical protein HO173_007985 [Letharia columbiana]
MKTTPSGFSAKPGNIQYSDDSEDENREHEDEAMDDWALNCGKEPACCPNSYIHP